MRINLFLSSALLVGSAHAFFRLPCPAPLIVERGDPIVTYGKVSGHTHTIAGGSGFSLNSTYASLRASTCTSCNVKQDLSAYWTPLLYIEWANGSFSSVEQVGGYTVYYLQRFHSSDKTKITAFPKDFRMMTGNPFLRTYNASDLTAQAIGWNCLGSPSPTRNPWLPTVNCPDGLRGEVRFPSCWNGKDVFKADGSHVAYSDGESGPCPPTHTTRLPTIFYEVMYSIDPLKNLWSQAKNKKSPFVLAMGDPTGYGMHGDFQNGWDIPTLQKAMDTCTNDSGRVEDCAVLDLYNRPADGSCQKTPDVNEVVLGRLPSLPGCNVVTTVTTVPGTCSKPTPEIFAPTVAYTGLVAPPGAKVLKNTPTVVLHYQGWKYLNCYSDNVASRALPTQLTITKKSVDGCLNAARAGGYKYAALEYYGECWVGNTLAPSSKPIGFGQCGAPCLDSPTQICGGSGAMDLYIFKGTTTRSRAKRAH